MKYRTLGRTGIKVSPYCLGAMMFGATGNPDHDHSVRIIHKPWTRASTSSTPPTCTLAASPRRSSARPSRAQRDSVVLATKARFAMGHDTGDAGQDDPNRPGASRRWLVRALDDSLRRLQTDHVDLFQIHRPDPDTLRRLTHPPARQRQ